MIVPGDVRLNRIAARIVLALALVTSLGGCPFVDELDIYAKHPGGAPPMAAPPSVVNPPAAGDVLLAGGVGANIDSLGADEFFHQATGTFLTTGPLPTAVAGLDVVALKTEKNTLLVAGGASVQASTKGTALDVGVDETAGAALYHRGTGRFATTGSLTQPRAFATAAVLNDGTVLIAGFFDPTDVPQRSAELYRPSTGTFVATTGSMRVAHAAHSATLLQDGTVLIVGGVDSIAGGTTASAELYDPTTGLFTKTKGAPVYALAGHTATLIDRCGGCLISGHVLFVDGAIGSTSGGTAFDNAENVMMLYNPTTGTFVSLNSPTDSRVLHIATLLPGGKVLIAGGFSGIVSWYKRDVIGNGTDRLLASAEIFDPRTFTFTCVGGVDSTKNACNPSMTFTRAGHSANLLTSGPDAGMVLLAGGFAAASGRTAAPLATSSAELFDPAALGFAAARPMNVARALHAAAAVP